MPMIDGKYCVPVDEDNRVYRAVSPLIRNVKDGSVMTLVLGGEFEMGDGHGTDCPKHRVHVDAYYIGVYCVTNAQYAAFVEKTGHRASEMSDSGTPVWANGRCPEEKLHHPVENVNWVDAMAYAEWAGLELATEAQWEKAARGQNNFIYPWGEAWDARKCRNDKNKGSGQTCAVWEYPVGASGYGTYNQSGNVWEWCRDWYGEKYYSEQGAGRNPAGPASGLRRFSRSARRVGRGGSWLCVGASRCRGTDRRRCDPAYRCGDRGFRLVRTA